jgi:predicted nucleic acid-binding protein
LDFFISQRLYGLRPLDTTEHLKKIFCKQLGVPVLLTDDQAVREAAKQLRLNPVGSLGLVARAYRHGYISRTEMVSWDLQID